jgi:hypothetical protein
VQIAPPERRELERRVRARSGRAEDARRARLMLLLASGLSYRDICNDLGCSPTADLPRALEAPLPEAPCGGTQLALRGRKAWVITAAMEARVLAPTCTARERTRVCADRRLLQALRHDSWRCLRDPAR